MNNLVNVNGKINSKDLVDEYWGENQSSPMNPKSMQILYYVDKFEELLHKLNIL